MKKYILVIIVVLMTLSGCNSKTNASQLLETSSERVQSSMVSTESSSSSSNNSSMPDESPSDVNISSSVSAPAESQSSNSPSSAPSSTPVQTVIEPDATTVYIELSSKTITLKQVNDSIQVPCKIYNNSSREVFSSPSYVIEKCNGAEWISFPFDELDQPNWPSVVYTIPADGTFDENLSYWAFEEEMTPGTYRLVKRADEEGKEWLTLYAKFSVTE